MVNTLTQYALIIFGFLSVLVYSYFKGKSDSKRDLESSQNKKKLEDIKTSKRIENEVKNTPSNDLDSKLSKWMRND